MTALLAPVAPPPVLDVVVPGDPTGTLYKVRIIAGHAAIYMPSGTKVDPGPARVMAAAAELFRAWWRAHRRGPALDCPVAIEIDCVVGRPLYLQKPRSPVERIPCLTRPDLSNCIKLYEDALKDAGVLRDDCIVVRHVATKMYVSLEPVETPHVRVRVSRWVPG